VAKIQKVYSREVLDSRGFPTVEVDVTLESGVLGRAIVPSGASTGAHEACELRDGEKRFGGKGVLKAVGHVNRTIASAFEGNGFSTQAELDTALIELDGTENKTKLGANGILGVSLAFARACALDSGQPLYQFLGGETANQLPIPLMNVINGGAHADNGLDVQEFMIVPRLETYSESLRAGSEIFHSLKSLLSKKGLTVAVGDEGGFAPKLGSNQEALEFLMRAIEAAGYKAGHDIFLALDVAATEFYKDGLYHWEGGKLSAAELSEVYGNWLKNFPLISVEDGLSEDDWEGWQTLTKLQGGKMQLVGDDLFVTNPKRLERGVSEKCANALLVKVNQIGTLTETRKAVSFAQESNYKTVMSHRSGETEDTFIADLAVALGCSQIKTGSLSRSERTAKYNQLLRIEEELGANAKFAKLPV